MSKTKNRLISAVTAVMVLMMSLAFIMPAVRVSAAAGNWSEHSTGTFTGGGSGSSASPLKISTPNELANLIRLINTNESDGAYRKYCYELTADIDLGGYEWTPLGTSTYKFEGSFDGKEHKIKNLTISSGNYVGLFGYIGTNGSIKNVAIESGSITGSEKVAGVCAANFGGSIENCSNSATVSGFSYVGGICGLNKGTVTGCTNFESGKVKGTASSASSLSSYIGGICGYSNSEIASRDDVIVSNCNNYAEIGENLYNNASGGICGYNGGIVQDCHNYNKVSGNSKVGGVCGESSTDIKDSSNTGKVNGTTGNVGGICGYCNQATDLPDFIIENCTNEGDVTCTYSDSADCKVGGVCGISNIKISNCTNSGKVYSPSPVVGGICGEIDDSSIIGCSNSGEVFTWRWDIGGVCGINYNSTIENCINSGFVYVDGNNVVWRDEENGNYSTTIGGICGNNWGNFDDEREEIASYSKIISCYNTGVVSTPGNCAGGICGYSASGQLENCYNTGDISGFTSVSGICGETQISIVKNCFNTGFSNGYYCVGGISGYNWFSLIEQCYTIGSVAGEDGYKGSVCGQNDTDNYGCDYVEKNDYGFSNCYYNSDLTELGGICGSDTDSVKGLTTIEMTCGDALAKMGFDTAEWVKKPNDKINKQAYYPNPKAFTYTPSVGYETELALALSDENAEYTYGDTIDFDVSALIKFDGMADFAPDTNDTPLASGKGSFTVAVGDDTVVTSTEICDNTLVSVTSSEINTSGDAVSFTLNYDGTGSDYIYDADNADTCEVKIANSSLTADDFDFTAPSNLVYDGKAKAATVKEKSGITGIGTITVKYYDADNNKLASAPIVPGTYTVKIDVTKGNKYSSAADLTANSWTFTIEKATPTVTVTAVPTSDTAGKTVTVTASAKNPNNEELDDVPAITLTYKIGDGEETAFTGSFVIPEGTPAETIITITAKTSENDYYNEGTGTAKVTVNSSIFLPEVTATPGENSVTLKWNAVDGAKSYRVFYRVNGTKTWATKNTTSTSVTIAGLTGGTKYDFLVLAYDGTNWSKYTDSDIINATPKTSAPAAPAKPVFTVTAGENSVTVKWTAVDGAASYRVFYRVNGTSAWTAKNTTTTSAVITGLTGGTKYDFLVRAYNGTAWSSYTDADIKTATPKAVAAPSAPAISSITPYENSAVIRWSDSDGATSYRVFYRINGTTKWSYKNTTQTAITLLELTGGKKYDFLVRAYNGKAWSAYTSQDIKNAVPAAATPKPSISSVTPGKNSVTVKWTAVDGASSYRVFYRVKGTSKWTTVNTTRTQTTLTGLTGGKTYEILVRSYSASGWSSYSPKDYAEAEIKS